MVSVEGVFFTPENKKYLAEINFAMSADVYNSMFKMLHYFPLTQGELSTFEMDTVPIFYSCFYLNIVLLGSTFINT